MSTQHLKLNILFFYPAHFHLSGKPKAPIEARPRALIKLKHLTSLISTIPLGEDKIQLMINLNN